MSYASCGNDMKKFRFDVKAAIARKAKRHSQAVARKALAMLGIFTRSGSDR
jgi:hypothetical protein